MSVRSLSCSGLIMAEDDEIWRKKSGPDNFTINLLVETSLFAILGKPNDAQ